MAASDAHAPVLSTHQDESIFSYAKVNRAETTRHLNIPEGKEYIDVIREYYSINELAAFLQQTEAENTRKYRRVTLQFPDSLICDSAAVVADLQTKLGLDLHAENQKCQNKIAKDTISNCSEASSVSCSSNATGCGTSAGASCTSGTSGCCRAPVPGASAEQRLWILADTSYSSCCVDEVAAEHVGADLVVHFGDACLNPVASLPSAYVFGTPQTDKVALIDAFKNRYPLSEFADKTIVLMADAPHTYVLLSLKVQLSEYNIIVADLVAENDMHFIGYTPTSDVSSLRALNRVFISVEEDDSVLADYELFHITTPQAPRLLQLSTKFSSVTTFENDEIFQGPFPNLMRRYRYMHLARAAGTIGILVNTLSLANTKTLIRKIGEKIKVAGKRHYVFVVGKPNVAKLANFDAVDLWCVLGCDHQGIILDEYNEYFKPIVTPYELLLAIGDEFLWTGKWVTEFERVLQDMSEEDDVDENKNEEDKEEDKEIRGDESDEEPEFDPVTGRYVSSARPLRRLQHLQISHETSQTEEDLTQNSNALVQKLGGTIALRGTVSTAAAHLQTREWKGLGSDWNEEEATEAAIVEEGTSGIARGYEFDTLDAAKNQAN